MIPCKFINGLPVKSIVDSYGSCNPFNDTILLFLKSNSSKLGGN